MSAVVEVLPCPRTALTSGRGTFAAIIVVAAEVAQVVDSNTRNASLEAGEVPVVGNVIVTHAFDAASGHEGEYELVRGNETVFEVTGEFALRVLAQGVEHVWSNIHGATRALGLSGARRALTRAVYASDGREAAQR
jgi:hypothetical protein